MASDTPKKKGNNLHKKYRLVIMNDETLQEINSLKLSRMNVYLVASSIFVLLTILVASVIVFSPLRYYIPGYGDINMRREIQDLSSKVDDMDNELSKKDLFIQSVQRIITDGVTPLDKESTGTNLDSIEGSAIYTPENIPAIGDTLAQLIQMLQASQKAGKLKSDISGTADVGESANFVSPLTQTAFVTDKFSPNKSHYGIDLADQKGTPIKAILGGTVIVSNWSNDTGWMIGIQHKNNYVSFYKHNSMLLKKIGNFVKAGEAIAIIGNSGENSTGPHLHLELWHNGQPVDPLKYIKF